MINREETLRLLTPTATDFVEVAFLERDGIVESRHRGIAAVTGPDGKLIDHLGSSKRIIYPRSAVKPLQAVAMRRAGLKVAGAELAICCGSHQGTDAHLELVRGILAGVGLATDALQCPTSWPGNATARAAAAGESREAFNCSGKHAGFLAASVAAGWDTSTYLKAGHPMQVLVRQVLEEFSSEQILHSTIDGCGAPLHTITVEGLARAFGKFALEEAEIAAAMLAHPWAVGDVASVDAIVMAEGLVAKLGAEGVFAVGTPDGHGVAVKIADGSLRAAPLVAVGLLHRNGLITDAAFARLNDKLAVKSMGGSEELGRLQVIAS
jgi:L-asparaginase II